MITATYAIERLGTGRMSTDCDVIQPFPTFSEIFLHGLTELGAKVPSAAAA